MGGWGVLEKWAVGGGQLLYLFLVSNHLPLLLQIVWHCVQTATVSKVFLSSPLGSFIGIEGKSGIFFDFLLIYIKDCLP